MKWIEKPGAVVVKICSTNSAVHGSMVSCLNDEIEYANADYKKLAKEHDVLKAKYNTLKSRMARRTRLLRKMYVIIECLSGKVNCGNCVARKPDTFVCTLKPFMDTIFKIRGELRIK